MDVFEELIVGDAAMRIRIPQNSDSPPLVIGLHGLSGDEEVMSIFAARVPSDYMVILPRGFFPSTLGGYSWVPTNTNALPTLPDFSEAVGVLQRSINLSLQQLSISPTTFHLMGFSQGAAFAYAVQWANNWNFTSIAAISGFMPAGLPERLQPDSLNHLSAFVSHGTKDELVPIEFARDAVAALSTAGAEVTYCEAEVGHKLSADCFSALHQFYKGLL